MEYSIRKLSEMAGVSARTLRYYDTIGLLKPAFVNEAGYRFYGEKELEKLQQILFYRERGLKLDTIRGLLYSRDFDTMAALNEHLNALEMQREKIEGLITAVKMTIASMKGEINMSDEARFEAFKKQAVKKNEEKYGSEIHSRYGETAVDAANQKMLQMSKTEYEQFKDLEKEILVMLEKAVRQKESPEGETGRQIAKLHRDWLQMSCYAYDAAMHRGIVQMYTEDARFKSYYDREAEGCAAFLKQAVLNWIKVV